MIKFCEIDIQTCDAFFLDRKLTTSIFYKVWFKGFNIHIFTSHYHATYDYNPLKVKT